MNQRKGVIIRKAILITAAALAVSGAQVGVAASHVGEPTNMKVIERIYPDLHQREVARAHPSWNHLRRMAAVRWHASHPAAVKQAVIRDLIENPTPVNNRRLAQLILSADDFVCMDQIVGVESSWVLQSRNPTSTAGGIPQALPYWKMASAGADYWTNPKTQIVWMKGYAEQRYGSLCAARDHRFAHGYY